MIHTIFSFSFRIRPKDFLREVAQEKKHIHLLRKSLLLYTSNIDHS